MRECSNCRENDRNWNCSLNYKCETETCENYIPLYYISVPNDIDISGAFYTMPDDSNSSETTNEYPKIKIDKTIPSW
jgi:hypothetical protein